MREQGQQYHKGVLPSLEFFDLLRCCAALIGNLFPKFQDRVSVPSSGVKTSTCKIF